ADLVRHLQSSGSKLQKLANLTSASCSYRDISVSLFGLQARQLGCTKPFVYTFSASEQAQSKSKPFDGKLRLPDVSQLSDTITVSGDAAPATLNLDQKYMDKISCWTQTIPSHLEMSYQNLTSVKLFPPVDASYPTYVDFEHATRLLDHFTSRKRLNYQRKMIKKRDKFQIKSWDHHAGEA
uniref:uS4m-2 n=1 Tax=Polytomella magna TaxID=353565 RepID=UPI002240E367